MAISQLRLKPGDSAIKIGCGTGLNFSYVWQLISDTSQLIDVDLTDTMLEKSKIKSKA